MKKKHIAKELLIFGLQLATVLAIGLFVRSNVIVHAQVLSPSMENTIPTYGMVIGSRLPRTVKNLQRFDIIVFENPINPTDHPFVKRIIGLPYETVEIRNGQVFINDSDTPLDDSFTKEESFGNFGPFTVPSDSFFVLGDHRNNSLDSRQLANPFIHRDVIIGRLFATYFPSPAWFGRP